MAREKTDAQDRYLVISEERKDGYFHLRGRIVTQRFEDHQWYPYGLSDEYNYDGGLLWTGLHVACQGDTKSQAGDREPVYGFSCDYREVYSIDLGKARRMLKTLELLTKKLEKIGEARGYVKSYGEYCGRIAEVFGCKGIGIEKPVKARTITGQRWEWLSIGDGVNRVNHRIYLWQQELVSGTAAADSEVA
jgi:hypothetical protein